MSWVTLPWLGKAAAKTSWLAKILPEHKSLGAVRAHCEMGPLAVSHDLPVAHNPLPQNGSLLGQQAALLPGPEGTNRAKVWEICIAKFYRKTSLKVIRLEEDRSDRVTSFHCPGDCFWTSLVFPDLPRAKVNQSFQIFCPCSELIAHAICLITLMRF